MKNVRVPGKLFALYTLALAIFFSAIFLHESGGVYLISHYGHFFFLGLTGALVANSTGAGGGVIFIPFFSALGINAVQSIATSMAIQCCGMTAGAISWLSSLSRQYHNDQAQIAIIKKLLLITGIPTIVGMLSGQYGLPTPPLEVTRIFSIFSIIFGAILLVFTLYTKKHYARERIGISSREIIIIVASCWLGGIVTSWISVGVGEVIALVLFFMRFNASIAVAIGVYTSSISVLSGIVYHTVFNDNVLIPVFLFAAQAAILGGYLAKRITLWLGSFNLKLFFALWIIATGIFIE